MRSTHTTEDTTSIITSDGVTITVTGKGMSASAWDDEGNSSTVTHDREGNKCISYSDKDGNASVRKV